jgi:hypothetical protein
MQPLIRSLRMIDAAYWFGGELIPPPSAKVNWTFADVAGEVSGLVTDAVQAFGLLRRPGREQTETDSQVARRILERSCRQLATNYRFREAPTESTAADLWFRTVVRPLTRELQQYCDTRAISRRIQHPATVLPQIGILLAAAPQPAVFQNGDRIAKRGLPVDHRFPAHKQPPLLPVEPKRLRAIRHLAA